MASAETPNLASVQGQTEEQEQGQIQDQAWVAQLLQKLNHSDENYLSPSSTYLHYCYVISA